MVGEPQGAMRVTSQIWKVVFASQTLPVFCFSLRKKAQYVVVLILLQMLCSPLPFGLCFWLCCLVFMQGYHILDFGCNTQQQEAIKFHSEGKLLNLKPLIYLFLVLGA
jgi:hypothetical protein